MPPEEFLRLPGRFAQQREHGPVVRRLAGSPRPGDSVGVQQQPVISIQMRRPHRVDSVFRQAERGPGLDDGFYRPLRPPQEQRRMAAGGDQEFPGPEIQLAQGAVRNRPGVEHSRRIARLTSVSTRSAAEPDRSRVVKAQPQFESTATIAALTP